MTGSICSNCQSFGGLDDWTLPTGGPRSHHLTTIHGCASPRNGVGDLENVNRQFSMKPSWIRWLLVFYTSLQLFVWNMTFHGTKLLHPGWNHPRIFGWSQMHPHRMSTWLLKTGPRCWCNIQHQSTEETEGHSGQTSPHTIQHEHRERPTLIRLNQNQRCVHRATVKAINKGKNWQISTCRIDRHWHLSIKLFKMYFKWI